MEVPEYFVCSYLGAGAGGLSPVKQESIEQFTVDDLLDFSNEDVLMTDGFLENVAGNSIDSSTVTVVDSCNSSVSGSDNNFSVHLGSRSFADSQFSGQLFAPHVDLAELEWLSNFVEDSFTAEEKDLQALHFLSGGCATTKPQPSETSSSSETLQSLPPEASKNAPFIPSETPLPGKARSKRTRVAACDWSKRLLHLFTPTATDPKLPKTVTFRKREGSSNSDSSGRKCLHCASEKTPQWRTGPMGPKTLCNACGVRYKSGRLVPEYRPASSPTFVSAKHSNSHRKVLELRRQKEVKVQQNHQYQSPSSIFAVSNGSDEFLIHHQGSNFRHMI